MAIDLAAVEAAYGGPRWNRLASQGAPLAAREVVGVAGEMGHDCT